MKNAAELGVAPAVYWASVDGREILMQFIEGGTLSTAEATKTDNIEKIAQTMAKVHSMSKNPYNFNGGGFKESMEDFYYLVHKGSPVNPLLESAIAIIRSGDKALKSLGSPSVTIHGDLNPRNILAGTPKIYFIDWSEGMYTDPFHDLAYYSLLVSYGDKKEATLLKSYLKRVPSSKEMERFKLAKKMNLARLAMGALYVINDMGNPMSEKIDHSLAPEEWSYYARSFADNTGHLSPQFFFGMAQAALKYANSL